MKYEDYTKEDIAEMQRVVCKTIKYRIEQQYPDIKFEIDVWEHFDYIDGEKQPTFKIRASAKEIGPRIIDGSNPKLKAYFEYCFTDIKNLSTDNQLTDVTLCTSTCTSNSEERMDALNEAFDSSSLEETLAKMKIKELELSIRLRDLEIERLMNKLNNK